MKNIIILFFGIFILNISCSDDEVIPSNREINWVDSLDMSLPLVKEFYEKYGVGLMTRFDSIRDFLYEQDRFWHGTALSKLVRETEIDSALTFLEESLLRYFTNDEFIKKYFPRKLLLTREVFIGTSNDFCKAALESDFRISDIFINVVHSAYNKNGHAFSIKLNNIYLDDVNYNQYKYDNFYIFLANLFERNNLYDEFDIDFYLPEMEEYYGRNFTGEGDDKVKPGVFIEEGWVTLEDDYIYNIFYWGKGFVSTENSNRSLPDGQYRDHIALRSKGDISATFPDKYRDVRNLLNQMIFVSESVYKSYPRIITERFAILMEKFDEWGIDIRAINPTMEYAFPRNR